MDLEEIKNIKFYCVDLSKELTIKDYLVKLLEKLWEEDEGFSGKRPFGNSGWQYDLYACLIKNNVLDGKLDEDGYVDEIDTKKADEIVLEVIKNLK